MGQDEALDAAKKAVAADFFKVQDEDIDFDKEYEFSVLHYVEDATDALLTFGVKWLGYGGGGNYGVAYFTLNAPDWEHFELKHLVEYIEGEPAVIVS